MKKLLVFVCLHVLVQYSYSQGLNMLNINRSTDSLNTVLKKTTKQIDRFSIINKMLENANGYSGVVDSSGCIQLLQIAQELNSDSLLAISYNWIGTFFSLNKGDNINALEYFFKAIPLAEKSKDKRRISSLYFDIALTYINLQNYEEAVKYIRNGGNNLPDKSNPLYDYMLAQYQRGMATYFVLTNQPDSALHYGLPMSETSRRAKSLLFYYASMHLNGAAYAQIGETEMADIFFKKALAMADTIKGSSSKLRFSNNYIPFLLSNNRFAEAKSQASYLYDFGNEINNNNLRLAGAGFLREVYDSLHNKDSAYYYSRMEAKINALIFSQNNINKIQSLAFDEKLRNMEEEDRIHDEAIQRKMNLQYALLALGIISFIILFLVLSRSIITNTRMIEFFGIVALLLVFEFLNLLLHPLLGKITHHSPILMLLGLAGIASLLVPLHHKLEKWATGKLVEKNKQLRLAAAKKTIEKLEGS